MIELNRSQIGAPIPHYHRYPTWPYHSMNTFKIIHATELDDLIGSIPTPLDTCSSVALTERLLARIQSTNDTLKAFAHVSGDAALVAADQADRRREAGRTLGPLDGMPMVIKDNVDIAGIPTAAGSLTRRSVVPEQNAVLVNRLQEAGAVLLGKAAMSEFALEPYGTNYHLGTARNPWNMETAHLPGGSSSGSAVAVAAGLAVGAIGTDTGGSCRLPAAWNGIVGMRPTIDSVPMEGIVPLSTTLDVAGPLGSSVTHVGQIFDVISGRNAFAASPTRTLPTLLRLGDTELDGVDDDILEAYDTCCRLLSAEVPSLSVLTSETRFRDTATKSGYISTTEGYCLYGHLLSECPNDLDPGVVARLKGAPEIAAIDYCDAVMSRPQARNEHLRDWGTAGCLVTPSAAFTAPVDEGVAPSASPSTFLRPVGYLGLCSISVPFGRDSNGLPIGMQIVGRPNDETDMFRVAALLEEMSPE